MADDSNSRYRSDDPYGRPPAQGNGSGQGDDPLAELARLIGRNDPFSEFGRDSRAPAPRPQQYGSDPMSDWPGSPPPQPVHSYEPFVPPLHAAPAASEPPYNPQSYVPPGLDAYQFGEYPQPQPGHADPAAGYGHQDHAGYAAPSGYDTPGYAQPADAPGFQPQPYPQQPGNGQMPPPHDDDFYDDAPQGSRRKGLITVMAVLGLAVLGAAGAFGYRSLFSGPSSSSPPPVIRANAEPSKVAPPPSNNENPNKLSYDRFGDRSQNEQVVLREEKPVDPKDLARAPPPRVILPGAPASSASAPSLAAAPGSPPSVLTEPKRVRTVPIRPDQTETSTRPKAIASAVPSSPAPAPAPRMVAAAPVNNAPLSLSPDSAPVLSASAAPARSQPTRVASAPSNGGGGGFLVQVTSQRSEADAQSSFRSIQSKYASVIGENQPVIRRADLGDKGVYYRAMVGPFSSRDHAIQLCTSLKAAGGACVVQGP